MAADRGAFIDQSMSLNIHIADPNLGKLTSMHFYAWKKGLKTGMYYLRSRPAVNAIQVSFVFCCTIVLLFVSAKVRANFPTDFKWKVVNLYALPPQDQDQDSIS